LSSKDKPPILGEPIVEVHNYNINKDILDARALGEALETTVQQHVADAVQTAEEEEKCEQMDDKSQDKQDPVNVRIRNSPIYTSPT
jgi:TPP-dependent pyruvate/acetoin dehydrogenase alpha subunit